MLRRFTNARVVTLDPRRPLAQAVLVAGDRIVEVGQEKEIRDLAPRAEVVDLTGRVLFPGFIESHCHVMGYGLAESRAAVFYNRNLAPAESREEILEMVREEARGRSKGEWITGRGYAVDRWPNRALPTRWELDKVAPDNPVALNDLGGHLLLCNSPALKQGDVGQQTPDPKNGVIHRDDSGEPSGPLNDGAMMPVFNQIPTPTSEQMFQAAKVAVHKIAALGITTVHHIRNVLPGGYGPDQIWPLVELERRGQLPLRVWLMVEGYENIARTGDYTYIDSLAKLGLRTGFGHKVKVGPIKIIVDGWMDARTSAQYEPYADRPEFSGYTWRGEESDYKELVWRTHRAHLQAAIHCDGIRSTDIILDAYRDALERLPMADHRHRFEHVPILTDEQIERMAGLEVSVCSVPSYRMEPWHKEMSIRAFGEKKARELTLRYRSLIQAGVHVFGGSDCHPCEERWLSPLGQIYLNHVEGPLNEAERLSREEAVSMFTTSAARGSFEEEHKGKIAAGTLADMVVLSDDPMTVNGDDLLEIRVERTIVGGETVYERGSSESS